MIKKIKKKNRLVSITGIFMYKCIYMECPKIIPGYVTYVGLHVWNFILSEIIHVCSIASFFLNI